MATSASEQIVSTAFLLLCLTSNFFSGCRVSALHSNKLLLHSSDPSQDSGDSKVDGGKLTFTSIPESVSFHPAAGSIKLHDVACVISLALGFSPLQDIEWKGLLVGNLFSHPKANILFIIEGLDSEHKLPFAQRNESYPIVKTATESGLDVVRLSPVRNFIGHISSILKEKPLVMSLAVEEKVALAISAAGINTRAVTWDAKEQLFKETRPGQDGMAVSKSELLKNFESANFGEGVKYEKENRVFVVSVPGLRDVQFDMKEEEDFLFFAEMEMIRYLQNKVQTFGGLLHDTYPDFFTFGISSLKGLTHTYGRNSPQVTAALHVLNSFIPKMSDLFSDLYDGQALVEVITLRRQTNVLFKRFSTEMNDIYEQVQGHLRSPSFKKFNDDLPVVNLKENLEGHAKAKICESVRSKLLAMQSTLEVSCGEAHDGGHVRRRREVLGVDQEIHCDKNVYNLAAIDDRYDSNFPPIFNIVLWLMIALALALYAVCLVLWYMDPGRDSIIYRVTSQRMKIE